MARQRRLILLAATVFTFALSAAAGLCQSPAPVHQDAMQQSLKLEAAGAGIDSPEFDKARRAIEEMTPEQRQRFRERFNRWMNLSADEKEFLRVREELRRARIAEEVDHALKVTGLNLDPARRELFAKRYAEERKVIEETLRKDTEERRKPLVQQMIARLKAEFSSASSSSTPAQAAPASAVGGSSGTGVIPPPASPLPR